MADLQRFIARSYTDEISRLGVGDGDYSCQFPGNIRISGWWQHSLLWAGSGVAAAVARCLLATGRKSQFIRSSEQQSRI